MKVRLLVDEELSRHDEENERHKKTIAELQSLRLDAETVANEEFLGLVANDGDELARSVGSALEFLDFQVEYLDDVREEGDKREDLRIRLPDVDDWEVIAEVRSYKGGAKEESYHRLVSKFIPGYILEKQRRPDCIWWFANTFRGRDLRERQPIMVSKPDLIQAFADIGGLAVDTADLLHLVLQVDRGEITREKARDRLVEATGVLKEFDRSPG